MHRCTKTCSLILILLFLTGCKEVLHSNLKERDANEIIAVLYSSQISAEKLQEKDGSYAVTVSRPEFGASIAALQARGLPRQEFRTLGDVFPGDTVVGTPFEERARFAFALSEEIAHTLTEIDGISFARVHVVIPEKGRFDDLTPSSNAALAIYHKSSFKPEAHLPQVKLLVSNAVPNLKYDDVSVSLFLVNEIPILHIEPAQPALAANAANLVSTLKHSSSANEMASLMLFAAVLLAICTIFLKVIALFYGFVLRVLGYAS